MAWHWDSWAGRDWLFGIGCADGCVEVYLGRRILCLYRDEETGEDGA
jgi:hypothetical protein